MDMELKGKPLSLGAKILGAVIAVLSLILKATVSPALDIDAALKVAAFVVIVFAPVDLSMVMGNIFGPLGTVKKTATDASGYPYPGGGGR
jgi:hypothetical protein